MAVHDSSKTIETPAPQVPRFVCSLNAIAEAAGFTTETRIDNYSDDTDTPQVESTWRGSRKAFLRLKFLPTSMQRKVHGGGTICWPGVPWQRPIVYGFLRISSNNVEFELTAGPPPRSIRTDGEVEISEYENVTAFHGSKEALIAAGICTEKQFPTSKRIQKTIGWRDKDENQEWKTQRYPDGAYVYWRETEAALLIRQENNKKNREQKTRVAPAGSEFKSAVEYRNFLADFTLRFIAAICHQMGRNGPAGPFCYSREAIEVVIAGMRDIYRALSEGQIETIREPANPERMEAVQSAQSDAGFQRFIQRAAGTAGSH